MQADVLARAESIDSYQSKCTASELNARARARCTYLPWNEDHFSSYALPGETIVTMNPSADGGMPHTRPPSTICLPAHFPKSILETTLKHERVHLDQRKRYSAWVAALAQEGWDPVTEEEIPEEYRRRCRLNPDTCWTPFWSWKSRYVPLPFYVREDKPELRDISVKWYDLEDQLLRSVVPATLVKRYGTLQSSALEHPFELMAYGMEKD